jgi:hypothetical protein
VLLWTAQRDARSPVIRKKCEKLVRGTTSARSRIATTKLRKKTLSSFALALNVPSQAETLPEDSPLYNVEDILSLNVISQ